MFPVAAQTRKKSETFSLEIYTIYTCAQKQTHRQVFVELSQPVDVHLDLRLGVVALPRFFRDLSKNTRERAKKKRQHNPRVFGGNDGHKNKNHRRGHEGTKRQTR